MSPAGDGGIDADSAPTHGDDDDDGGPAVRRLDEWDADRLRALAEEYDTPLYVIDRDRVRRNCRRLRAAFPDADVRYAAKAHTGRAVLETVREAGLGVECASAGEVERALAAGVPGERLHYTAVNPPARDLDRVVARWRDHPDLTVTAGARDTLDRLADRGYDGRVCLRVNPGVGAGHHEKVRTGADATFGVPYDRAAEVAAAAREELEFDLVGLHAHAGSGIGGDDLDAHRELVRRMGELGRAVAADGARLEYVDVGGGFGVPYREDEPPLDLDAVADATRAALGEVPGRDGRARLAVEPGRYVVADAGVLLTRVNTVKPANETTVVGVDAGMTTLLRPAMYGAYHAIRNLDADADATAPDRDADRPAISATVTGPICESADVLCENRRLPDTRRGDLLAVGNAGAYGYEMANTYNSRPRPAEVALGAPADTGADATTDADRGARLVRRRERIADLTRLECDAAGVGAGDHASRDDPPSDPPTDTDTDTNTDP